MENTQDENAASGSLERLVRWLCREIRQQAYAMWAGGCFAAAGWGWMTWQFYVVIIPLCVLVCLRESEPSNDGSELRPPE